MVDNFHGNIWKIGCFGQLEFPLHADVRGVSHVIARHSVDQLLDSGETWWYSSTLHIPTGNGHFTQKNVYAIKIAKLFQSVVQRLLPALIMGSIAIFAGLLGFLLPETRGKKLPETFDRVITVDSKFEPVFS